MCSVIEIKNANEYYIHYHSPESIPPNALIDGKKMEENTSINSAADDQTKLKVAKKDQEVTSDRGSSASPSLEDEDEQQQNAEKVEGWIECPFSPNENSILLGDSWVTVVILLGDSLATLG